MRKTLQFSVCETVSSWANTASDAKSWGGRSVGEGRHQGAHHFVPIEVE
jgi:hypothetical protein